LPCLLNRWDERGTSEILVLLQPSFWTESHTGRSHLVSDAQRNETSVWCLSLCRRNGFVQATLSPQYQVQFYNSTASKRRSQSYGTTQGNCCSHSVWKIY
jgi:hypothetical protein